MSLLISHTYVPQAALISFTAFLLFAACSETNDVRPSSVDISEFDPLASGGEDGWGDSDVKSDQQLGGMGGAGGAGENNENNDEQGSGGRPPISLGGAGTGPELPPLKDPLCVQGGLWHGATSVGEVNTNAEETLKALSRDTLTLVFSRDGELHLSDRETVNDGFDSAEEQPIPDGFDIERGMALSPDGLHLVLSMDNGGGFASLQRESRNGSFEVQVDDSEFVQINRLTTTTRLKMSHPVFALEGQQLWYLTTSDFSSVWVSEKSEGRYPMGQEVGCNDVSCDYMLFGPAETGKRITSVSEDLLTVFFLDEEGASKARWRNRPLVDSSFFEEVDLEHRFDVRVNADCSRLYYTDSGDIYFDNSEEP